MCALFGRGVKVWRQSLRLPQPELASLPLALAPVVRVSVPLAPRLRALPLVLPTPRLRPGAPAPFAARLGAPVPLSLAPPSAGRADLALEGGAPARPPLGAFQAQRRPAALPPFTTRVRGGVAALRTGVRRDLEAARRQPLRRRMVKAADLTVTTAARWVQRLSDARRVPKHRLQLVGIFPGVALTPEAPVRYLADAAMIVYPLPEGDVPLSTVVVARRTDTGEAVVARFH